jgi:23S rRNA pseudouridine1911/1915/1917 synthase
LAGIGHPILGDHQYGSQFSCPYEAGRILLHAETIAFHHPFSKKFLSFSAPLPDDFKKAKQELHLT